MFRPQPHLPPHVPTARYQPVSSAEPPPALAEQAAMAPALTRTRDLLRNTCTVNRSVLSQEPVAQDIAQFLVSDRASAYAYLARHDRHELIQEVPPWMGEQFRQEWDPKMQAVSSDKVKTASDYLRNQLQVELSPLSVHSAHLEAAAALAETVREYPELNGISHDVLLWGKILTSSANRLQNACAKVHHPDADIRWVCVGLQSSLGLFDTMEPFERLLAHLKDLGKAQPAHQHYLAAAKWARDTISRWTEELRDSLDDYPAAASPFVASDPFRYKIQAAGAQQALLQPGEGDHFADAVGQLWKPVSMSMDEHALADNLLDEHGIALATTDAVLDVEGMREAIFEDMVGLSRAQPEIDLTAARSPEHRAGLLMSLQGASAVTQLSLSCPAGHEAFRMALPELAGMAPLHVGDPLHVVFHCEPDARGEIVLLHAPGREYIANASTDGVVPGVTVTELASNGEVARRYALGSRPPANSNACCVLL